MRKLLYLMLLLPIVVVSQVNESFLLNLSEITVKPGHSAQFIEGVKLWKECYVENNGEDKWNIWKRVQGEGTVYTMTSRMAKWAEMDENADEAGKACRTIVLNFIIPHVKSVHYNIARSMPDVSTTASMEDATVVWVYNAKTSNSTNFMEVVKEITAATKKVEGNPRGTWYSLAGGSPGVADYFVALAFKNFAELDIDKDNVWKVYEKVNGKPKTDALRAKMRASLSSDWSYIYSLNKELSN